MLQKYCFSVVLLCLSFGCKGTYGSLGIPGTSQTTSGYDTELGEDPICWLSKAARKDNEEATTSDNVSTIMVNEADGQHAGVVFPNKLVPDFLIEGKVELLTECPQGMNLRAFGPVEHQRGERLRTGIWYDYFVQVDIDLEYAEGDVVVSNRTDQVHHQIAAQIVVCDQLVSGFCSPFVHEQANARLYAQGITKSPKRGDRHGGTHVHSPSIFVDVLPNVTKVSYNITVPMLVNDPGNFYAIGAVMLFTGPDTSSPLCRYDMANALMGGDAQISYQDPAIILRVSNYVRIITYLGVGFAASVIGWLFFQTVMHRNNQVIVLSQSGFLIVFLGAALCATLGSLLLDPRNSFFCGSAHAVIFISLQLMYAITHARLWRIHAVISPLLLKRQIQRHASNRPGDFGKDSCCGSVIEMLCKWRMTMTDVCCGRGKQRQNFRQQVPVWKVVMIVVFFTLPQIGIQLAAVLSERHIPRFTIDYNQDESVGRQICSHMLQQNFSLIYIGLYFLLFVVLLLLLMAHANRQLPSLLNESQVIYDTTLLSVVIFVLGLGIVLVTDSPTTSPDVQYLVWVALVVCITLNSTLRIMLPKLRMVWRGERILVSKLVSDHRETQARASSYISNVSGLEPPESRVSVNISSVSHNGAGDHDLEDSHAEMEDHFVEQPRKHSSFSKITGGAGHNGQRKSQNSNNNEHDDGCSSSMFLSSPNESHDRDDGTGGATTGTDSSTSSGTGGGIDKLSPLPASTTINHNSIDHNNRRVNFSRNGSFKHKNRSARSGMAASATTASSPPAASIVVTQDTTPARRLILRMMDLQEQLELVTSRVTSGLSVDKKDWSSVRSLSQKVGVLFSEEVVFDWERQDLLARQRQEHLEQTLANARGSNHENTSQYGSRPKRPEERKHHDNNDDHTSQYGSRPKRPEERLRERENNV